VGDAQIERVVRMEILTVMRLDPPENPARALSSTNLIENLFSRVHDTARRVRRWQGDTMILRWTRGRLLETERNQQGCRLSRATG
jgi:hypothetical protein